MTIQQLLREWPPGYGGIERVAHELANCWGGEVYSLDVQNQSLFSEDSCPVAYSRRRLCSIRIFGRLHMPLPSRTLFALLLSAEPLHGHLPSPGVLIILVLARLVRPTRIVTAHWHCFLERKPGLSGFLYIFYQWIALRFLPYLFKIVTTSPLLSDELLHCGCSPANVFVLPCCLSAVQEQAALSIALPSVDEDKPMQVLFIGRLGSYKRLDWLLESLEALRSPWRLSVVGDGPNRRSFEYMTQKLFSNHHQFDPKLVQFHGRLTETEKYEQIANSDLLVLPSDSSNEAFGIVQLEAMAAGRISLAFDMPRSGMGWVGQLSDLSWSQSRAGLAEVLQRLADQPALRVRLSSQSRERYCMLFARQVWLKRLEQLGYPLGNGKVCISSE